MKISELNKDQKGHLAWLLDKHTYVGLLSAGRIADGEFGDTEIVDVFLKAEKSKKISEKLAKQVETFVVDESERRVAEKIFQLISHCHFSIRHDEFSPEEEYKIYSELSKHCKQFTNTMVEAGLIKKKKKKAKA